MHSVDKGGMEIVMKESIENQFDSFCKRVLKNKVRDYKREEARRLTREIALEEWVLKESWETIARMDQYLLNSIRLKGNLDFEIQIQDEDLYKQLTSLTEEECQILLLSYFLDFTDEEIGRLLKRPRRTVAYQRRRILEMLKSEKERGSKNHGEERATAVKNPRASDTISGSGR